MAMVRVNPTRMELRRLKGRLKTAVRGHKLLKDKSDEMIRQFSILIKRNKQLREQVQSVLSSAIKGFTLARAVAIPETMEEAILVPSKSMKLDCGYKNVMSVLVPSIKIVTDDSGEDYPYSFSSVTSELDSSIKIMNELMVSLIELAEIEKACNMLAIEIEKNKRRVNALEYVMIPELNETIKYITMKLDENERANLIRLMKVKSMIENRNN